MNRFLTLSVATSALLLSTPALAVGPLRYNPVPGVSTGVRSSTPAAVRSEPVTCTRVTTNGCLVIRCTDGFFHNACDYCAARKEQRPDTRPAKPLPVQRNSSSSSSEGPAKTCRTETDSAGCVLKYCKTSGYAVNTGEKLEKKSCPDQGYWEMHTLTGKCTFTKTGTDSAGQLMCKKKCMVLPAQEGFACPVD